MKTNQTDAALSTEQIKTRILEFFNARPGSSQIEVMLGAGINGENFHLDLPTLMDALVEAGELVEVTYVFPSTSYVLSIYYPKTGTITISPNGIKHTDAQGLCVFKVLLPGTDIRITKN